MRKLRRRYAGTSYALIGLWVAVSSSCALEFEEPVPDALSEALTLPMIVRDNDFGDRGALFSPPTAGLYWANAVAVRNGQALVAGHTASGQSFAVARYTPEGDLDATFRGGSITRLFPSANSDATEVAYQPDGKIIVAGHNSDSTAHHCYAVVRLLDSGATDPGFGVSARPLDSGPAPLGGRRVCFGGEAWVQAMALQADGKILLAGFARPTLAAGLSAGLVRLTPLGELDRTFDADGIAQLGTPGLIAEAMGIQSDGKIVIAGHIGNDFAIERYHSNGSFDRTFNASTGVNLVKFVTPRGVQSPDSTTRQIPPDAPLQSRAIALSIDGQDRIVVAGHAHGNFGFEYNFGALARLSASGTLDRSFGAGGKILSLVVHELGSDTAPAEPARFAEFTGVSSSNDGSLLVVGSYEPLLGANEFRPALLRFDPSGAQQEKHLDTFSPAGSSLRPLGLAATPFVARSQSVTIVGLARSNGTAGAGLMRYRNGTPLIISPTLPLTLPLE